MLLLFAVVIGLVWVLFPLQSEPSGTMDYDLGAFAKKENSMADPERTEVAVLAGGCFWCVEAVYERIGGVVSAVSGYTGGSVENPGYNAVVTGRTGHAEAVRIEYDPDVISYAEILNIFWRAHDPTTLNRQGADVGTQYRSAIFYTDESQKKTAEESLEQAGSLYDSEIVTEISPLGVFYPAEDYHQDYFAQNPNAGYCRVVIAPKLDKLGLFGEVY
jgi:peptide-methionine (S)-S-oxide reductase